MGWIFSDARRDERPAKPRPKLPSWIRFEVPADAHPAAAAALIHSRSLCKLIKVWVGDESCAGAGVWEWVVLHPDGRQICVAVVAAGIEEDGLSFLASADAAVRTLMGRGT